MRRALLNAAGRQIHYRVGGDGAPVVLLHPSPLSSTAVLPVARALAQRFRVYALDTPGYGLSEPPAARPAGLDAYLPLLAAALDALGLGRICLVGAATGAQLAVEFAKRYPERVARVVLDSAGHFEPAMIERVIDGYFPDVAPQRDGSHLMTVWNMVRDLGIFFPWSDARAATRVPRDLPPPAALQALLLDYLRAGARYDWAYRPAFHNENAARTAAVTVPTAIVRWSGSLLLPYTDALLGAGLPANFAVLRAGPEPRERIDAIVAHLSDHYHADPAPPPPAQAPVPGRLSSQLLDAGPAALHLRFDPQGEARPLVLLHAAGSAAAVLESLLPEARDTPLGRRRPLLLLDLPGHGESEGAGPGAAEPAAAALRLRAALERLGWHDAEVAGIGYGGCVALELGSRLPVTLLDLPQAGLSPLPAPQSDGTHLFAAWTRVRDAELWAPGPERLRAQILPGEPWLDPAQLHRQVVALMLAAEAAEPAQAYAAACDPSPALARGAAHRVVTPGGSRALRAALHRLLTDPGTAR